MDEKIPKSTVVSRAQVEEIIRRLERQIGRIKPRVAKLEANEQNLSIHGYRDLGYFRGRLSAMEDMADDLKTLLDSSEERWVDKDA